ncbi:MAG: alpha/beta fold hydrolase [Deltaproteobacteria bacterium]
MASSLTLQANGIRFHALAEGPLAGPLVLLLHGFPELALSWKSQLAALGQAGYRAVAPDLRGYGGSDRSGPFDGATLAKDVVGLVRALGRERAVVVGHDWGGGVAYDTATFQPAVVERLVLMNCPPAPALATELLHNPRQLARSWYVFLFQLPWLPERLLTRKRAAAVARALRGGSHVRSAWTRERLRPYQEAFSEPGAASAALGYYRAALRHPRARLQAAKAHPATAPTLIVWGMQDRFLGPWFLDPTRLEPWFAAGNLPKIAPIAAAGHFVQTEAPGEVNRVLLDWLGPATPDAG